MPAFKIVIGFHFQEKVQMLTKSDTADQRIKDHLILRNKKQTLKCVH